LLEGEGKVVTREQLRVALWPEDTFVDFEHGVNTAIKKLRQALGDSFDRPKFIETLPKAGYRFLVPVEWMTEAEEHSAPNPPAGERAAAPEVRSRKVPYRAAVVVLTVVGVCAVAAYLVYRNSRLITIGPEPSLSLAVASPGEKYGPSLSPDGKQLAYAWNGGLGPNFGIYVKLLGSEEPIRLTRQEAIDFNPVWSPDGHYIVYCRIQKGGTGVYIIPAIGGAERKLRDAHWELREFEQNVWYFGRVSWSPDGTMLAISDRESSNQPTSIYLLSLDTLAARKLTSPGLPGDYNPAFSPDGQTLAFNRGSQGVTSIYTLAVKGGNEHLVASGSQFGWGLAWTADGRSIVFGRASWLGTSAWLWKISANGGDPERLQFGQEGTEPSIRGHRLAYARQVMNLNIWKRQLNGLHPATAPSTKFLTSTAIESGPQFSPDGGRIAFESTRDGGYEIWTCRSDGSNLLQLTHYKTVTGTPRWSPDGKQIAFDSRAPGNADIFVMDSEGGSMRQLTHDTSADVVPSWSRDGRWIYFASDRGGDWQIWKMPSEGGPVTQVTQHGGYGPVESVDGRFLYYTKYPSVSGIWRMPSDGGEEAAIIPYVEPDYWGYWGIVNDGIFFLDSTNEPALAFYDFATHRITRVFELGGKPAREVTGLAVSPDGRTVLYTLRDSLSRDIVLVENYR